MLDETAAAEWRGTGKSDRKKCGDWTGKEDKGVVVVQKGPTCIYPKKKKKEVARYPLGLYLWSALCTVLKTLRMYPLICLCGSRKNYRETQWWIRAKEVESFSILSREKLMVSAMV